MTTAIIRERLHEYINAADDKKVSAIYIMVEDEIAEGHLKSTEKNAYLSKSEKLQLMQQASTDKLFLADVREITEDFAAADKDQI